MSKRATYCSIRCSAAIEATARRSMPPPEAVPGCRWIALGNDKFTLVDQADYDVVNSVFWHDNGQGYAVAMIDGKVVKLHHMLAGKLCDHISRDPYDNRRSNLRPASKLLNSYNRKKRSDKKSSPYVGVSPRGKRWIAILTANKVDHYLGYFNTAEEAAAARDEAAKRLHGEFARLTLPNDGK